MASSCRSKGATSFGENHSGRRSCATCGALPRVIFSFGSRAVVSAAVRPAAACSAAIESALSRTVGAPDGAAAAAAPVAGSPPSNVGVGVGTTYVTMYCKASAVPDGATPRRSTPCPLRRIAVSTAVPAAIFITFRPPPSSSRS